MKDTWEKFEQLMAMSASEIVQVNRFYAIGTSKSRSIALRHLDKAILHLEQGINDLTSMHEQDEEQDEEQEQS